MPKEISLVLDAAGRIAYGGSLNFAERRFHFDRQQLDAEFMADCRKAFTARNIDNQEDENYSAGSTYFLRADKKPRCALEAFAQEIFQTHTKNATFDPKRSGAEW